MHRKKRFRTCTAAFLAVTQCVTPAFAAAAGVWEVKNGDWMYKGEDGVYLSDAWLRDPQDGRLYHLNGAGVMDSGWMLIDGVWYFLDNCAGLPACGDGVLLFRRGWEDGSGLCDSGRFYRKQGRAVD